MRKPQSIKKFFLSKIESCSYHMEQEKIIEASYNNNIYTWENFCAAASYGSLYVSSFFSEKINFSSCKLLVWCAKVYIYFKKEQFKMLITFFPFFLADTKIIFCYNFVALVNNFYKLWKMQLCDIRLCISQITILYFDKHRQAAVILH